MSSDIAVRAIDLSKRYQIYDKPRDRLLQGLWRGRKRFYREFWALKGVSFEVRKGETVGIIGRNGSGKSTLLQLICGTLAPTGGSVVTNGRVGALLELGAGFNPEFTGRENVQVNASILGLSRETIARRFDEIAEFAEIGEFMEQPVKTYSSGMFLRLAFAVQVFVDPDVLVVDEALAVGDVFFRQKCYQRLEALRERGVAILLVSHALTDVQQFCDRAILLDHGKQLFDGSPAEAVNRYYLIEQQDKPHEALPTAAVDQAEAPAGGGFWPDSRSFIDLSSHRPISNGWAQCTGLALCNSRGQPQRTFEQGETAFFYSEFEALRDLETPIGGVLIRSENNVIVHGKNSLQYDVAPPPRLACGERVRFVHQFELQMAWGEYTFDIGFATISRANFSHRASFGQHELDELLTRLVHIASAGVFSVVPRARGEPIKLMHYGLANLPGSCSISTVAPSLKRLPVVEAG